MTFNFFVGTYTLNSESLGIYDIELNLLSGQSRVKAVIESENPSYLEYDKDLTSLYVCNELGEGKGAVSSFKYSEKGIFRLDNAILSMGDHPCHLKLSKVHQLLFVSNYSGGSLAVFNIDERGTVKDLQQLITYTGQGPNLQRQSSPHIHSSFLNKTQDLLYVQDLGTDTIYVYHISKKRFLEEAYRIHTKPSGGPRHLTFSKNERFIYILLELTAEILVYTNDQAAVLVQCIGINSENFEGKNGAAAIRITNDGKHIYASNRGDANRISVFSVDEEKGTLTFIASSDTGGRGPRDFDLSPCNLYLLVTNQYTDQVVVYGRNPETGTLTQADCRLDIPSPVCIKFY